MKDSEVNEIFNKIKELTEGYKGDETILNRLDWLKFLISAYQKYLPARVIEKIKINPAAEKIEGERRYITVLFADLSGFTALSETMDAEEIANIINDFFTRMVKIVHKYGGSVDKFLGDALMVLFGAPVAHHDDPERAVRAALEMQHEMERFNAEKKFASPLSMSIGINTGPAVALNVGSDERMEYTVIGDTVNLAARLESISGPKEIIISNFTYEKIADIVDAEKRPPVKVKGKKKPVVNYLVKGIQEHHRLPEVTKIKFIARVSEISVIKESLSHAKNNILGIIAISGESGCGKTRLGIEGELIARKNGFSTFAVRCVPYETNTPYNVFIEFFNNYFQLKKDVPEEEKKLIISIKLQSLELSLDYIIPYIGTMYGMEFPDAQNLTPDELKRRIFNGIKEIIKNEAKKNPIFIRIEDLQWADPTSIEIFDYLLKELKYSPIIFLFEYRSDWAFPWLSFDNCTNIFLKNFTRDETGKLIQSVLDEEKIAQEIKTLVFEKSMGNPLFATEILKMLMIKNGIRKTKEGYIPTERFKKLEVAESVSSVILDQIDRMSEMDRRILQYASVLGRSFDPNILSKILKIPENNLVEELERLEHFEGFLTSNSATNTYEFTSPTTYEVVYNSLLKTKRKELHTEIGRELERIPEVKIFENLERLAHHFARSNDERKGVHYLKSAADKSYRLYALKETLSFFDQALELLHKKELSPEELRDKMEIYRRNSLVLRLTGNLFDAIKYQKRSLTIARKLKSLTDEAGANLNMGEIIRQMGQPQKALSYLLKARKIAHKIGNKNIQALAENNLGNYYLHIGNLSMAERCFLNVINFCIEIGDRRSMALANLNLGNVAERNDNLINAIKYYSIAHSIFEEIGDKENTLRSLHQIAISQMLAGDIDKSLSNLNNLADLSVKYGDRLMESLALGSIGEIYGRMWQLDKAYEYFSKSLAIAQMLGEPQQNIVLNINIGDVHLYQGNLIQATGYHKKAVEIAKKIQDPFNEALAHRSLGLDYYYSGNYKEAVDELSQSVNIFEEIGDRRNRIISLLAKETVKIKIGYTKEIEQMLNELEKKAKEVNDLEILSLVLDTKAIGIISTKEYGNAQPILEQLSDLTRQIGNKRLFAWTNAKLSEVQFNIGLSNQGEKTLEKTLRLAQELGDRILESFVYLINAKRLVKITEYVKALNLLMKANELANQCSSKQLLAESLLITGEIYRRLGKNKDSEEYFKNYKKIVKEMTKEFSQGNKKNLSKFSD